MKSLLLVGLARHVKSENDQTHMTTALNLQIRASDNGAFDYTGGPGVLVRNPFDEYESNLEMAVVPATFWSNDIYCPSQLYPSSPGVSDAWDTTGLNPDCPNDGWNGFFPNYPECTDDPGNPGYDSPWNYAATAYVIGSKMGNLLPEWDTVQSPDWGWGVFYPTDANAVDYRCRYLDEYEGYDCGPDPSDSKGWGGGWIPTGGADAGQWSDDNTKLGTGAYEFGNPFVYGLAGGGGSGCHLDKGGSKIIDQTDAFDFNGVNILGDNHCQCSYDFSGSDNTWSGFVDHWVQYAAPKAGLESEGWFANGKAPNRAMDQVSCWVNNFRDMIALQNQFWWKRFDWNNQLTPKSDWSDDPASQRIYWGWNEIPARKVDITAPSNRDAMLVKLPAGICGDGGWNDKIACLGSGGEVALERELDRWVNAGYMVPGKEKMGVQPGSDMALVREYMFDDGSGNWNKYFYCENWTSPNNKWKIVFKSNVQKHQGHCYLEIASATLQSEINETFAV